MSSGRKLQYGLAINEALHQTMAADPSVFLIGRGAKSRRCVGNTARGLIERFGEGRVIDAPVSEKGITGAVVGAALAGMRPVVAHPRMDSMVYAMGSIMNEAADWYCVKEGKASVPVVIWVVINRGGEWAARHSQALHATFAHMPGLKVVMPSTPYDAKGLMVAAIRDPDPVVFIDDWRLRRVDDTVPEEVYEVPIGKAALRRQGTDVTLAASSYMAFEAMKAVRILEDELIDVELIDLRTVKPLDEALILESVARTGRLVVADGGWKTCGLAAEIAALAGEHAFECLRAPIRRVTLPDCPAPAPSRGKARYPTADKIVKAVREVMAKRRGHESLWPQKLFRAY